MNVNDNRQLRENYMKLQLHSVKQSSLDPNGYLLAAHVQPTWVTFDIRVRLSSFVLQLVAVFSL